MNSQIRQKNNRGIHRIPVTEPTLEAALKEKVFTAAEIAQLLDEIRKAPHRICSLHHINQLNDQLRQALKDYNYRL